MTTRRNFLRSAAGLLIAAPMVVRAENIMRVVKPLPPELGHYFGNGLEVATLMRGEIGFVNGFRFIDAGHWKRGDTVLLREGIEDGSTLRWTEQIMPVMYKGDRNRLLDLIPENYTERLFNALRGK